MIGKMKFSVVSPLALVTLVLVALAQAQINVCNVGAVRISTLPYRDSGGLSSNANGISGCGPAQPSDAATWAQYTATTTGTRLRLQSCRGNNLIIVRSTAQSGSGLCDNMECMGSNYNNTGGCKTLEVVTERSTVYYFGSVLVPGSPSYELNVIDGSTISPATADSGSNNTAIIIAGAVVGGIVFVAFVAAIISFVLKRRSANRMRSAFGM